MDETQRKLLDLHLPVFATSLDYASILPFLVSSGIFAEQQVQNILCKNENPAEARQRFVNILKRSGPDAFLAFCSALEKSGQYDLLQLIQPYYIIPSCTVGVAEKLDEAEDGNAFSCISGQSSDDEMPGPTLPTIKKPTQEEIHSNERYYLTSSRAYADISATKGLLTDLAVKKLEEQCNPFASLRISKNDVYPNFSTPKGLAFIVNNRDFKGPLPPDGPLPHRVGTDVDCRNLCNLFTQLGYAVKVKHNLAGQEMINELARFALKSEHAKCHSSIVAILSHGRNGELYGVDGELVSVNFIISLFTANSCRALRNKPKLFFIQACRGERYDPGEHVDGKVKNGEDACGLKLPDAVSLDDRKQLCERLEELDMTDARELEKKVPKIPSHSDMLICYATTPGYVSWRNSVRGSWFVQAICEVFAAYADKEDIHAMLTRVNKMVAEVFESSCRHKQISSSVNQLLKTFYFFPGVSEHTASMVFGEN